MKRQLMKKTQVVELVLFIMLFLLVFAGQLSLPERTNLRGMLAQLNVLVSVFFVTSFKQPGVLVAQILNALDFLVILIIHLWENNAAFAFPGIILPLTTLLLVTILGRYLKAIQKNIEKSHRQKEALEKSAASLRRMAYHDPVTGLLNLKAFMDELRAYSKSLQPDVAYGIAFFDLDDFKYINDTLGHVAGDTVLASVAHRFLSARRPGDVLGRIGGDEFALLIKGGLTQQQTAEYLGQMLEKLKNIWVKDSTRIDIHASVGAAFCPKDSENMSELLQCADSAMFQSKHNSKGTVVFFSTQMREALSRSIAVEREMHDALERGELSLAFQPQYEIKTRRLLGFEALMRWNSPVLGPVSPEEFIPKAEFNGLIHPWGHWALTEACRQFLQLRDQFPPHTYLSVNLSAVQLQQPNFLQKAQQFLQDTGMPTDALQFEITESVLISDPDLTIRVLHELTDLGILFALDDFGKGYSSLGYLQKMPIHIMKIDKNYITAILAEGKGRILLSSIIQLAHNMGLVVLAEGVETEEQLTFLQQNDCDALQGYLWGKPMPLEQWKPLD